MPFGALLALAGTVIEALGRRKAQGEHGLVALGISELGIGAEVSDEHHAVQSFSHNFLLFLYEPASIVGSLSLSVVFSGDCV